MYTWQTVTFKSTRDDFALGEFNKISSVLKKKNEMY